MSDLFPDIQGPLSDSHMKALLLMHNSNTDEFKKVFELITEEQRKQFTGMLKKTAQMKWKAMRNEQRSIRAKEKEKQRQNSPHPFYGNMGEPENREEYKAKYGVYPN